MQSGQKPSVWIGKSGLTEAQITEIKNQLKKKRLIKVKLLRSGIENREKKDVALELSRRADCELIGLTGLIVTLRRK